MQTGNQNEVARHVHQTRHEHEQQRRTAVAQTAEHRREQVVRHDEQNAAAADAHIARCQRHRLLRRLHEHRDRPRKADQQHEQHRCEYREHDGRAAEHRTDVLFALFTDIPRDEHGNAHCELCHDERDQIEQLTAGRNRRQTRGRAEPPDNEQIDCAVGRLQNQCAEHRQHEPAQLFEYASLRKIRFVIRQGDPSSRSSRGASFLSFEWHSLRPRPKYPQAAAQDRQNSPDYSVSTTAFLPRSR